MVTNLSDHGPGSLRDCVQRRGPRLVIFAVGGTITLDEELRIDEPYLSVYGQSAPGGGILLRASPGSIGAVVRVATHDVLLQHLRIRAGSSDRSSCCRDALSVASETTDVHHVVLDHLSLSWGLDEIVDLWYDVHDVTLSRSIIAEGLYDNGSNDKGPAGRGLLIGSDGAHSISVHHNLIAHSYQRNPMINASGTVDVVNNLVYHWLTHAASVHSDFGVARVNFVGNRWIPLLDPPEREQHSRTRWGDVMLYPTRFGMEVYFRDNFGHHRRSAEQPEWAVAHVGMDEPYRPELKLHAAAAHPAPSITSVPASELEQTLPNNVGATLPVRDAVDRRILHSLTAREGLVPNCVSADDRDGEDRCAVNAGGWPIMDAGRPAQDSDSDGMPDPWERDNGFDPARADSLEDRDGNGYLNLEQWLFRSRS